MGVRAAFQGQGVGIQGAGKGPKARGWGLPGTGRGSKGQEECLRDGVPDTGVGGRRGPEHLEAHLLGLLGVHSSHMLVMPQRVPLLLLLGAQVTAQGQQDALGLEGTKAAGPAPALCTLCPLPPQLPHLRRVPLQCRQETFQGRPALVVDKGDDSGGVGLHQALSLTRHLLLQGLQNGLEVLVREGSTGPAKGKMGESPRQRRSGEAGL